MAGVNRPGRWFWFWSTFRVCHSVIIIILLVVIFFIPALDVVFLLRLSDSKSPQVSRTLLNILADLNNVVVWMVSARLSISISSSVLNKILGTAPSAPIIIGVTVTFMFHSYFSSVSCLAFRFLRFSPSDLIGRQNSLFDRFFPFPFFFSFFFFC